MGLSNSQYQMLMREYSRRQNENLHEQANRVAKVYQVIPQMKELDQQISSLAIASAQARLNADPQSYRQLQSQRQAAIAEKTRLLAMYRLPADYLELHYHCPDCQDTGYIDGQKCHCLRKEAIRLFYTQSGMEDILEKENFDTFSLDYYDDTRVNPGTGRTARENMVYIHSVCQAFAKDFDQQGGNLLLFGGTGLGKTFLSHCIVRELIESSHSCIYYSAFSLFEKLAQDAFSQDTAADPFMEYLFDCDLLVIDDLGTELTNAFVSSRLFSLLNGRLVSGKSTIISTNLTLQALSDTYSERVFSRITSSFKLLGLYGDDIRLKKIIG